MLDIQSLLFSLFFLLSLNLCHPNMVHIRADEGEKSLFFPFLSTEQQL